MHSRDAAFANSPSVFATSIVKFKYRTDTVYLATGPDNVQERFHNSFNNSLIPGKFILVGAAGNPSSGMEGVPVYRHYWARLHHILHEIPLRPEATDCLAQFFITCWRGARTVTIG
ncbi:uncharacterized protein GLRG_01769 [Colletotrichum graminicola M1.001]|uniref:Uncharacterized protein n=1 Tax=Colletotrichum graminicola (strain M1.001 / M2 / FGSC 10212) TaxID=645133 RepID=E3Q995_COLGM|nr:uncharacterized protein GLRG_01769 [Colletotrichum graminicola M1.001]EFQ27274.1 hypothetical protein GLRG_01769 [Colletotrichum graminicola M1.001]